MASPGATIALTLAEQVAQKRLKAYHGSPHDFDEFSTDNIGTGEGAQAYGHGLYFAEREGTAKNYRDALSADTSFKKSDGTLFDLYDGSMNHPNIRRHMAKTGGDLDSAIEKAQKIIKDNSSSQSVDAATNDLSVLQKLKENGGISQNKGSMYEVGIDASPDELIDYDAPLSEQSDKVKEIAALYNIKTSASGMREARGADIYSAIASAENTPPFNNNRKIDGAQEASNALNKLGIKGIRYKDAQTRFSSDGATRNYVIFDEALISISKKYGVSIPVAAAILGGSMTPEEAMADQNLQVGTQAHASDDIGPEFLEERQQARLKEAQERFANIETEVAETNLTFDGIVDAAGTAANAAVDISTDLARGLAETPQQILAGIIDATAEPASMLRETFGELPFVPDDYEPVSIGEADSNTGAVIRSISQFMTGFLPAMKGLEKIGVANKLIRPMLAGFITDATVFDPFEEKLSDLIQSSPMLANPVNEYLVATEDDSDALARFKAGLEGLGLGVVADGLMRVVDIYKRTRKFRQIADELDKTPEDLLTDIAAEDQQLSIRMGLEAEAEFIPFDDLADQSSVDLEIPGVKMGKGNAKPEDAKNINLNNLETTDDVKALIDSIAEADSVNINNARRETITNQETQALADDLGMSVDDLLSRRAGVAPNAEEALAARQILVASGENLIRLAKVAETGTDADLVLFRRAMAQHQAIQMQVSGMTAEAGRALQSFRIMADGQKEQQRAIEEALSTTGGAKVSKAIASKFASFDDPQQLGKFVRDSNKATSLDMVYEVWINALLSNPATHTVNAISNMLVPLLSTAERKVASYLGDSVVDGESAMMLKGMVEGAKDGLGLAWASFKSGRPSDSLDKVEVDERAAISAKNLNKSGVLGQFADFVGTAVRVPGRLLTTSDEFFKAVGYRMELNAQAFRTAYNEGLEGDNFAKRVAEIIENPPENIHLAAVDFKRYQTFTNELGEAGKKVEGVRNLNMFTRTIAPFIRTPLNIMTFTVERTPLGFATQKFRTEMAAGGARGDLALAKIATGSMIMASAADLSLEGKITGGGPSDYRMKNQMRSIGWQPYSFRIGDTYYAYNRLDPIGSLFGLAADIAEITGQGTEADAVQLATASVVSLAQNLSSKTYLKGVSEALDVINSSSTDPTGNNYKAERWVQNYLGTIIPSGLAAVERVMSPELSATQKGVQGIIDRVKSRLPGYSDDLPPRRNMFGDVVVLEGGLGPDIMSPVYTTTIKKDSVIEEMIAQEAAPPMVRRKIGGVELTPEQYDRYILLAAGEGGERYAGLPTLKSALKSLMQTSGYKAQTDGPDGGKQSAILLFVSKYKDIGQKLLKSEYPELAQQINQVKIDQAQKKMPQ